MSFSHSHSVEYTNLWSGPTPRQSGSRGNSRDISQPAFVGEFATAGSLPQFHQFTPATGLPQGSLPQYHYVPSPYGQPGWQLPGLAVPVVGFGVVANEALPGGVPFFGSRSRGPRAHRTGHHGHGGAYTSGRAEEGSSVEDIVQTVQSLPLHASLPDSVYHAMQKLDSRAVALLLKDLSRLGLDHRAVHLFDWLRGLNSPLCDVFTYTAAVGICVFQQDVERAIELVEEMAKRGVERNVFTFTSLMNVAIKCGKLNMALEVYHSMESFGCSPNVVTFNSLADVYGKLGQWENAVGVVDVMRQKGVEPVLRTYNTCLIACNMCNQPREALAVYHRLLSDGFAPNSTTYNALISAYGKTAQLERALEVYSEMLRLNMERNVITYSSLISACEKAGQWEAALSIFNEMTRDGCAPNTVTYNSLITACSQGGQWQKANEVFEQMSVNGCMPDVVTYTALISAFERGGQWQRALQAFYKMCLQGCKPDAIVYNAIIDTLWETGIIWAQTKALELFGTAVSQGHFKHEAIVGCKGPRAEVNVHAMTAGVAMLALYTWLMDIKRNVQEYGQNCLPRSLAIVTDMGRASREQGNCIVKEAVAAMMIFWDAPFRPVQDATFCSVLEATGPAVAKWAAGSSFDALLASVFPISENKNASDETFTVREAHVAQECSAAFQAVMQFEGTHGLVLQNMSPAYTQQRHLLVSRMLELSSKLGLRDEVVHDAVLLMDRTASTARQVSEDVLPLVSAASLVIAAKQGGGTNDAVPSSTEIAQLAEVPPAAVVKMEWNIRGVLGDDLSCLSAMRCLKTYLERLGYRYVDKQDVYGMAGFAIMLAVESLYDVALLNCRPSVVAAAILYAERRFRGAIPFWPSMLSRLTGYSDMATPELSMAVRAAQKLCRKVVYAQIYKTQLAQLAVHASADSAAAAAAAAAGQGIQGSTAALAGATSTQGSAGATAASLVGHHLSTTTATLTQSISEANLSVVSRWPAGGLQTATLGSASASTADLDAVAALALRVQALSVAPSAASSTANTAASTAANTATHTAANTTEEEPV